MVRVLHIFHNMGNGGIENFVMNYYRFIDRQKVQFDFLTSVEDQGYFDEEILSMGGKIFHAYPFRKNPIKNYKDIARIVGENNYTVVHRHTGSAFGYFDLRAARRGGAKIPYYASSASHAGNKIVHNISKNLLKIDCIKFACSKEAGEFLFGKDEKNIIIINNAIDAEKFCFSAEKEHIYVKIM
ncbi:MAG: glycosyltransferase [Lachnoclostridium sp.]